jgi:outer membrane receptor protein involved in Fe transport
MVGSQTTLIFKDLVRKINLDAELSLSFLNRQDHLPNVVDIVERYFTLKPKHNGKLKVSFYPLKKLYVNVESQWETKWLQVLIPFNQVYDRLFQDTDGYYSMNLMTSYELSNELSIYLKAINLFDEPYGTVNAALLEENLLYNPQLRRNFRFGLSYRLN